MKYLKYTGLVFVMALFSVNLVSAHFGMLIPSDNMVMQEDSRKIDITLSFSHPFEMIGMPLENPQTFYVVKDGKTQMLNESLQEIKVMAQKAWKTDYTIKRPGV